MIEEPLILELIAVQKRIAAALELENKPQIDGFCDVPQTSPKYIFLDGKHPGYWYMLDELNNRVNCPKRAIAGTIECLNLTTASVGGDEKEKLDIWLRSSHGTYVMRTGWETLACNSLLSTLIELPENLLKEQVILSPYKLSDKKTIATNPLARDALYFDVWSISGKVYKTKHSEPDCMQMLKQINFLITGEAITSPKEKIKDEISTAHIRSSQLLTREQLMERSGQLARSLGWDTNRGKEYLMRHYGVKGRTLLTDEQLINFVARLQELVAIAS